MLAEPPARPGPPAVRGTALDVLGGITAATFHGLSRLRSGRILHPLGLADEAEGEVEAGPAAPGSGVLARPGTRPALVRFSRGAGVPQPLPDALGLAIKLPDAHGPGRDQDFLLITSSPLPVAHHLILPARSFLGATYSSVLLYRTARERLLVGARHLAGAVPYPHQGTDVEELGAAAATGELAFEVGVARLARRLARVGVLRVGARRTDLDDLHFNPWHTGGGMEPIGLLNRLRAYAYPASQAARGPGPRAGARAPAAPGAVTSR